MGLHAPIYHALVAERKLDLKTLLELGTEEQKNTQAPDKEHEKQGQREKLTWCIICISANNGKFIGLLLYIVYVIK